MSCIFCIKTVWLFQNMVEMRTLINNDLERYDISSYGIVIT